jgi:hypothetical protein
MFESIKRFFTEINWKTNHIASLVIATCIIIIFFIVPGIYFIANKNKFNTKTTGTIKTAECDNSLFNFINEDKILCNLNVSYNTDKRSYTGINISEDGHYEQNDEIPIWYNSKDPRSFIIRQYQLKTIGISLLSVGIALIIIIWLWYSLVNRIHNYNYEYNSNDT